MYTHAIQGAIVTLLCGSKIRNNLGFCYTPSFLPSMLENPTQLRSVLYATFLSSFVQPIPVVPLCLIRRSKHWVMIDLSRP